MPDFWVFDHPRVGGWVGLSPKLERVSNCMCGSMEGDELVGMEIRKSLTGLGGNPKIMQSDEWQYVCRRLLIYDVQSCIEAGQIFLFTEIKILCSSMDEVSCRTDHTL